MVIDNSLSTLTDKSLLILHFAFQETAQQSLRNKMRRFASRWAKSLAIGNSTAALR
jgi:hypothetical protein